MLKNLPSFLKNRYVITLIAFAFYMIFFNEADVVSVYNSNNELSKIQEEIDWYKQETANSQARLISIEEGGFELEKLAREKHFLQRENEQVFVVKSH